MPVIDTTQLKTLATKLSNAPHIKARIVPHFQHAMIEALKHVHAEMPSKSGQMIAATDVHYRTDLSAELSTDDSICPYAKYVYGGTRAHKVRPVEAQALQWFTGGRVHYAREVIIPAKRPNPFLDRIWNNHENQFIAFMESAIATELNNP